MSAPPNPGRRWRVLFLVFASLWAGTWFLHPEALVKIGVYHYRIEVAPQVYHELWFHDLFAILASNDAVSLGKDPYAPNALDYQGRPHIYGPLWLHLRDLGLTRRDKLWLGFALDLAFFAAAMATLRPRCLHELLWSIAVFCSPPVLFALERANNDLVIFLLYSLIVPCLLSPRPAVRWLAPLLIALATDLKFYPAVAGVVLLAPETGRSWKPMVGVTIALLVLVGWHVAGDLARILPLLPHARGLMTFGATAWSDELGWHVPGGRGWTLLLAAGGLAFAGRRRWLGDWRPAPEDRRAWLQFVLGAVLLTACFLAGSNFAYRWIFALWLAPLLWTLARSDSEPPRVRRLARVTAGLLLVMLWYEPLWVLGLQGLADVAPGPAMHAIALSSQPFTWAFFGCLAVFLGRFGREACARCSGRA